MTLAFQRTFLFDHLPKTGGTALRLVFHELFGKENVTQHLEGRSEIWAVQKFSGFRVISGHFLSLIPNDDRGGRLVRLTVLRHPIDRAISEYFYWRNHSHHGVDDRLGAWAQRYDIADYFAARMNSGEAAVTNFCTRHFASRISREPGDDEKMIELAKQSLGQYKFVGISEYLHDTVDVFCWQFGLPPVAVVPHANVTRSRIRMSDLDSRAVQQLTRMNELDIQLYEHALNPFEQKKRRMLHALLSDRQSRRRARPVPKPGGRLPFSALFGEPKKKAASEAATHDITMMPASGASPPTPPPSPLRKFETFGDKCVEVTKVCVVGAESGTNAVVPGETVSLQITLAAHIDVPNLTAGIEISDSFGEVVFGTNTFLRAAILPLKAGNGYRVAFSFRANLNRGRYSVGVALHTGPDHSERCFHWCDRIAEMDVVQLGEPDFVGYCRLDPKIEWEELPKSISTPECDCPTAVSG
ncbi:MAG TPA: Wzt carbohydrate-binding domain-containing protein [Rhizomicrobium sp.]|jgi:hypothetical protein|nr:Wzt carbohydrate-binding domain-containing protein [Rhizomicrobium sp.]